MVCTQGYLRSNRTAQVGPMLKYCTLAFKTTGNETKKFLAKLSEHLAGTKFRLASILQSAL